MHTGRLRLQQDIPLKGEGEDFFSNRDSGLHQGG